MTRIQSSSITLGLVAAALLGPLAGKARGQAYVPAAGEGTVSILYQDSFFKYHRRPIVKADRGQIQARTFLVDTTYGLTDRVALDLSLPYVFSNYSGPFPHQLPIDDGKYHGTFQDVRFALRYNMRPGRFAVTPFVGTVLPSHGYEYFAHSAAGRRLRELQVGTYVAKLLDPVLPGAFVQARYSYGFTQRILDVSHNRSNAALEVGYFITPAVRVFAMGSGQLTHGGIDLTPEGRAVLTPEQFQHHDQIDRLNYLDIGAGGSIALSDSIDVFASVLTNVTGRNGHVLSRGLNVGLTWGFKRQRGTASATTAEAQASSLVRCLCQKGDY